MPRVALPTRRTTTEPGLGPLNPPRVGLVLLRGNDVPAKLGYLPRGNVTAPETPKVCLGNSIKLDAVHAGGDPCRFGPPLIKPHGDDSRDSYGRLNGLGATISPVTGKTHQRASVSLGGQIGRKGARAW
jgi:hypothetical protein